MNADVKSMDLKKNPNHTSTKESLISAKKLENFIVEIKSEIFKVHWTSREELLFYAKIVALATLFFGMSIYFLDLIIQMTLNALSTILNLIG